HSVSGILDRCACVFRQLSNCWRSSSISAGIVSVFLVSINLSSLGLFEGRLTLPAWIMSFHARLPEEHDRLKARLGDEVDVKYVYNILDLGYREDDINWLVEGGVL